MSIHQPVVVDSPNISTAWGAAMLHAYSSTDATRTPVLVCISGFSATEPEAGSLIRASVDRALQDFGKVSVEASPAMIFPYDFWLRRGKPPSKEFSDVCVKRLFPRLKARDPRNRFGTYFERMMGFTGFHHGENKAVDQLHFVDTTGAGILVAPFGGIERRLSANPIAAGIPIARAAPILLDISACTIAEGKIKVAEQGRCRAGELHLAFSARRIVGFDRKLRA